MKKIIFATSNEGKMKEIREILKDLNVEILSLREAGFNLDIEENGVTFEENAIMKAKAVSELTSAIVLADDSGIEIDYLDKGPGVYSARFMGEDTPYTIKNQFILDKMVEVPESERSARFVCVIAAIFPDGKLVTKQGTIEGTIVHDICGTNGFGYDPIFYVPEYQCTTAEMPSELKNSISHRGKALKAIKEIIAKYLVSITGDEV